MNPSGGTPRGEHHEAAGHPGLHKERDHRELARRTAPGSLIPVGMIGGPPIALYDVLNCEAYVQRCVDRSQIEYDSSEREELLEEGLTILFELATNKYVPLPEPPCGYGAWWMMSLGDRQAYERRIRPPGTKGVGRFSGYAAMFLPRRLGDAWHKWHPNHRYLTDPETGKRGWYYDHPMISLDELSENPNERDPDGGDRHLLHARALSAFVHTATLALLGRTSPSPPV